MSSTHWTQFAGLAAPGTDGSALDLNSEFIFRNPDVTDQFLKIGAKTHRHDGSSGVPNPTAVITTSNGVVPGNLQAATDYFVTYTVTDAFGGETLPAPGASATTGGQVPSPANAPSAGVSYASGIMPAGSYAYALTYTDGLGGETTLGPTTWVSIEPGHGSAQVNLVNLSPPAPAVAWRLWRSYEGEDWHLVTQGTSASFTDAGYDPPDNPARPPDGNTTGLSPGSMNITLPASDPAFASGGVNINIYLSTGTDFWGPCLWDTVPVACAGTTLLITDGSVSDGEPPHRSTSIGGAPKINGLTEVLGWRTLVAAAGAASASAPGKLTFVATGGATVAVTDQGGGSATVTIGATGGGGGGTGLAGVGGSAASPFVTPVEYIEFAGSGGTQVGVIDLGGGSARVLISLAEGPEYVVRATGGDDYTNLQGALNSAMLHAGRVRLPDPLYKTSQGLVASAYCNIFGAGMDSTKIQAASAIAGPVLDMQWSSGNKHYLVQDLTIDGNALATTSLRQYVASETSVAMFYVRVQAGNATGYQFVNHGCEDAHWIDCQVPGNEGSPTTTPDAIQVVIPNGAMTITGGAYFGVCDLSYQTMEVSGVTLGPIVIENGSNLTSTTLSLDGCYVYDGGPSSNHCIDTTTNLTNIVAKGCYFVAQVQRNWVNGNVLAGTTVKFDACSFVWGPGTAGANYAASVSGAGNVVFVGWGASVGSGTFHLFQAVSGNVSVTYLDSTGQIVTPRVNSPKIFLASGGSTSGWAGGFLGFTASGATVSVTDLGSGSAVVNFNVTGGGGGGGGGTNLGATTAARAYMASLPGSFSNGWNKIALDTVDFDLGSNLNVAGGNHKYTCPATGVYDVKGQVLFNVENTTEEHGYVGIYVNGSRVRNGVCQTIRGGVVADLWGGVVDDLILCNAGDIIELYFNTDITASGVPGGGDVQDNYLSIVQVA